MINLGIVYMWSWLAKIYGKKDLIEPINSKPNSILVLVPLISLVFISGFRYMVGTDYWTYTDIYYLTGLSDNVKDLMDSPDVGFLIMTWLLNKITDDPQIMFFVTALITNAFVVRALYNYARPFELGMFLYICTFNYYASFNGVRQYMVAAIIFWAVQYLIEGNWKKYFSIVIIAATFHSSAIIMIPVYFLARRKAWTGLTVVIIFSFVGIALLYNKFLSIFIIFLQNTPYGHYEEWLTNNSNGMNIIKIFVLLLPLLIAYLYRNQLRKLWPESDYIVNLCIIGFLFGLLATRDVIFARFNIYFGLYQLLLIPYFTKIFDKKINTFVYFAILICYFLYSFMLLPVDSHVLPYKNVFFE